MEQFKDQKETNTKKITIFFYVFLSGHMQLFSTMVSGLRTERIPVQADGENSQRKSAAGNTI